MQAEVIEKVPTDNRREQCRRCYHKHREAYLAKASERRKEKRIHQLQQGVRKHRSLLHLSKEDRRKEYDKRKRSLPAYKEKMKRYYWRNRQQFKKNAAKQSELLQNCYVRKTITKGTTLKASDIPQELIAAKREYLQLVREKRKWLNQKTPRRLSTNLEQSWPKRSETLEAEKQHQLQ